MHAQSRSVLRRHSGVRLAYAALLAALGSLGGVAAQSDGIALVTPPSTFEISDSEPKDIVVADFDRDGHLDLAFTASVGTDVTVMLGDGNGGVRSIENFAAGASPWGLGVGLFDSDAIPDLVVTRGSGGGTSAAVFRGLGNGRFQAMGTVVTGAFPLDVAVGDCDGDQRADLVIACNVSGGARFNRGLGGGAFGPGVALPGSAGLHGTGVELRDLDGDGKLDVAFAHYGGVSLYRGDGLGSFLAAGSIGAAVLTQAVRVADLDGDGDADLALLDIYAEHVRVYRNDGGWRFVLTATLPTGQLPHDLALGDLNGDGIVDVAAVSIALHVWAGHGDLTFLPRQDFGTAPQPWAVATADLAGDGFPEVIVALRELGQTPHAAVYGNLPRAVPWQHLGLGLAGATGLPLLIGRGTLAPLSQAYLDISHGPANTAEVLVLGATRVDLPLFGGTSVPAPTVILPLPATSSQGAATLPLLWPDGMSGASVWLQVWLLDPTAPAGLVATNGTRARGA